MGPNPVHFQVEHTMQRRRIHVAIRLVLLLALGAVGYSSIYWLLYLCLPAVAALLIAQKGGARYLAEDAPALVKVLRWITAAYAYLWLLTDDFELLEPSPKVGLELSAGPPPPSASSAMLRLLYSLPAVLLVIVLSFVAGVMWVIGAVAILINERLPLAVADVIALTLRYQVRLVAYHLSLVEAYPSLETEQVPHTPQGPALRSQT